MPNLCHPVPPLCHLCHPVSPLCHPCVTPEPPCATLCHPCVTPCHPVSPTPPCATPVSPLCHPDPQSLCPHMSPLSPTPWWLSPGTLVAVPRVPKPVVAVPTVPNPLVAVPNPWWLSPTPWWLSPTRGGCPQPRGGCPHCPQPRGGCPQPRGGCPPCPQPRGVCPQAHGGCPQPRGGCPQPRGGCPPCPQARGGCPLCPQPLVAVPNPWWLSPGALVAAYRKLHLFDAALPGAPALSESSFTNPGRELLPPIDTPVGKLGLAVCYDLRFPELAQALRGAGAQILTYPSAFTVTTGAAHWEVLLRARAIECQCYVVAAAQSGRHNASRASFGHSLVADPWGTVVAQCHEGPGLCLAHIDLTYLEQVRRDLPVHGHRRGDIYGDLSVHGHRRGDSNGDLPGTPGT
uniref:Nitrilase 1 n=1 Tax=Taeniopygia guttata TaxID=59729 RepID=A0A674GPX6_TAEGU